MTTYYRIDFAKGIDVQFNDETEDWTGGIADTEMVAFDKVHEERRFTAVSTSFTIGASRKRVCKDGFVHCDGYKIRPDQYYRAVELINEIEDERVAAWEAA